MKYKELVMRTPIDYSRNLKSGIVTKDMLASCLYSVNKRAKNARDNEKKYRGTDYHDKYKESMVSYYGIKDSLLVYAQEYLSCIHKVKRSASRKVYDYDEEYHKLDKKDIIRRGEFFDREELCYTKFAVVAYVKNEFFLFYDFGDYSFHHPLDKDSEVELAKKYKLPIIEIDNLETHGKDFKTLLSVQFVKKILASLDGGTATVQKSK